MRIELVLDRSKDGVQASEGSRHSVELSSGPLAGEASVNLSKRRVALSLSLERSNGREDL
jgi:hypothetical protein